MYRYRESDLCPFQLMACAGLSIHYPLTILTFTSHSHCNVFLIHPWRVTDTCAFREFTSDPYTSINNRLGLSLKLSAHKTIFCIYLLHSSIYHSQNNLIFCVQKLTIKSSNVEMSKMNSRNFEKFRFFFYFYRVKRVHIRTQQVLKFGYLA